MKQEKLKPVKNELERLYNYINKKHKLELPSIIIHTQSQGRSKNRKGWLAADSWKSGKSKFCEVNVCAEYLNNSFECCNIILHEITHLYCLTKKIKDTCRGGTYHTIKFKKIAEMLGLKIKKRYPSIGFGETFLSKDLKKDLISKFKLRADVFDIVRIKNKNKNKTLIKLDDSFYILSSHYENLIENPDFYLNKLSNYLNLNFQQKIK